MSKTDDQYQTFARVYDPLLHPFLHPIRKKTAAIIEKKAPGRILDICCGTGNQLKYLKKRGFQRMEGIDISLSMLNQAGKGDTAVNCSAGDASAMPFNGDQFDLGIISFALHEKPKEIARTIIEEAKRVIKPGGSLMIVDYALDNTVHPLIRMMVNIIERMAGKEHFRFFRKYVGYGGMDRLLDKSAITEEHYFHFGATRLRVYRNKNFF